MVLNILYAEILIFTNKCICHHSSKKISATDGYYEKFPQLSLLAKQDAEKKEDQGEEGGLGPALVKMQEAKNLVDTPLEKRPMNFGTGQDI